MVTFPFPSLFLHPFDNASSFTAVIFASFRSSSIVIGVYLGEAAHVVMQTCVASSLYVRPAAVEGMRRKKIFRPVDSPRIIRPADTRCAVSNFNFNVGFRFL